MSSTEAGDWICVRTQPRRELWAKENIERYGLMVLCPMFREEQSDKVRPLFPSYLFTLIQNQQWYFLFSTFGVSGPLMRDGKPEYVRHSIMHGLQRNLDHKQVYRSASRLGYRQGQPLTIKRGPFAGLVGTYDGMSAQERVRVLLDMLGQSVIASVSHKDVTVLAG